MYNLPPADIDLICNFEDLDKNELSVISSPEGLDKLKEMRAHIVEDTISKRKDYASSSGYWIVKYWPKWANLIFYCLHVNSGMAC